MDEDPLAPKHNRSGLPAYSSRRQNRYIDHNTIIHICNEHICTNFLLVILLNFPLHPG